MSKKIIKIIFCIALIGVIILCIYSIYNNIIYIKSNLPTYTKLKDACEKYDNVPPDIINYFNQVRIPLRNHVIAVIISALTILLTIFEFVQMALHSKFGNFTKYTYEEYKQFKDNQKAIKQEKKKAKLQKQLSEMEKTE